MVKKAMNFPCSGDGYSTQVGAAVAAWAAAEAAGRVLEQARLWQCVYGHFHIGEETP